MASTDYLLSFILVAAVATFATRALPFLFLSRHGDHPLLVYLGRYLPPVMMVLLVGYAGTDLNWQGQAGLVSASALLLVALVQWFGKNALLSIFVGALFYMLLI